MSENKPIIFDIETGPLPEPELRRMLPELDRTKIKGAEILGTLFDPTAVRTGNMTDPAKIKAKIEDARKKHNQAFALAERSVVEARQQHWQDFQDKAALKAHTGRVLAIGYISGENSRIVGQDDSGSSPSQEGPMLVEFLSQLMTWIDEGRRLVGFNIFGFDLPFMFRRMWILGQRVSGKDSLLRNNRQWHENLIDLMKVWGCGVWGEYIKLDTLAKALGVGQKPSEVTGANFHEFWNGTKVQRAKAKAYLVNDLKMTQACAERLGVK